MPKVIAVQDCSILTMAPLAAFPWPVVVVPIVVAIVATGPYLLFFALWGLLDRVLLAQEWRKARRAKTRIEQRLCLRCGYDLRATPLRCPECGSAQREARRELQADLRFSLGDERV